MFSLLSFRLYFFLNAMSVVIPAPKASLFSLTLNRRKRTKWMMKYIFANKNVKTNQRIKIDFFSIEIEC